MIALVLATIVVVLLIVRSRAGTEEKADDFMELHQVEIAFHEARSTKNLDQMLSLFADDAVMTAKGKNYTGKEQIKRYWQAPPAFRICYDVDGDHAHLYFECLWVDKKARKIAAHTNPDDMLARINGRWPIKE